MKGSLISLFLVHSVICEVQRRDANDALKNQANSSKEYQETWKMGAIYAVQNKTWGVTGREVELLERAYVVSLRWIIGDIISQLTPPSPADLGGEKTSRKWESLRCVAVVADSFHEDLFGVTFVQPTELVEESYGPFPTFVYRASKNGDVQENDNETLTMLRSMSKEGCGLFVILMKDGESAGQFLRFGERYRELDTRAKFILIYDRHLLQSKFQHLWKKITNVVFLRPHVSSNIWFELLTVSFPLTDNMTKLVDIWSRGVFRTGNSLTSGGGERKKNNLFPEKTNHLQGQTLKVFTFDHVPSAIKKDDGFVENSITGFHGIEIMILETLAKSMNFCIRLVEVSNDERWGLVDGNGNWTGLFGAVSRGEADVALGNLFYTPYFLEKFDLSIPYTVQCLTFLTPESRTDNSWATLVLPFKASTWGAIISTLIVGGFLFRSIGALQLFREQNMRPLGTGRKWRDSNKVAYPFSRLDDAILYSWGMLLQVPLPAFPSSWPLRLLTGCWWLFCLLAAVAYRSSMTAVLSSPPPRLVYDTLSDLASSGFSSGGWGEESKQFFSTALDAPSRRLAKRFETLGGAEASPQTVAGRVAGGHFAYYENEYWLRDARARYLRGNGRNGTATGPYSLHVMRECAIKMPISLGLRQNSPLKTRVDRLLRRMVEAGLIGRWLKETMEPTMIAERNQIVQGSTEETEGDGASKDNSERREESKKALMNLRKMYGALFALGLGYLIGFVALISEIAYHRRLGKKTIGVGPWLYKKMRIDSW